MRRALCGLSLSLTLYASLCQAQLPTEVSLALRQAKLSEASVALWVSPVEGGPPRWQHQAQTAFNPASTIKLLTTYAALDKFGSSYTWRTQAFTQAPLQQGVLNGDIFLRGSGDPALTWDRFGVWLRDWRARGLQSIQGDLVLDRSLFPSSTEAAPFDDQPSRAYNATPDPLLVNFKSLSFLLRPGAAGSLVQVGSLVPLAPFQIQNQLVTTSGSCNNWREALKSELKNEGDGFVLQLSGQLAASCGERTLNIVAPDGPRLAGAIFRALWRELGGTWTGRIREGSVPPEASLITQWTSPTLAEIVRDTNKFSNNVMARQLYLALGADNGTPLSLAASDAALRSWLASHNLNLKQLVLENGSGLSRSERLSAEEMGQFLQLAWQSPRMPELLASLPVAGQDGTARRRFAGQAVAGRAYLKTGSLNDVMSIAGFVKDAQGQWQIIVMFINDPRADAAEAALIAAVQTAFSVK